MADKEHDDEFLERISANTELAFKYQKKDNWLERCRRYKDMLYGKYFKYPAETDRYIVNTVYNLVNLAIPFWFIRSPEITCIPKRATYEKVDSTTGQKVRVNNVKASRKHQHVLNKVIKEIKLEKEIRRALLDQMFYGVSIIKVGVVNKTESTDDLSKKDSFKIFVKRVNPELFGYDPVSTEPNEARFLCEKIIKHKKSFDESANYENKDDVATDVPEEFSQALANSEQTKDFDVVTLVEYHDQENDEIAVFSGCGKNSLHRRSDDPFKFKESHYATLTLTKGNDDFFGIPPIAMVEDQIYALIESYSMTVQHQKLFPGQVVVENDAVDSDDLDSMEEACQGSIISVQAGALKENKVQRWTALHLNQEYFQMLALHREMIERTLGISDSKAGLARKKSATESQLEEADENVRETDTSGLIKDWILDITKKVSALIKQYYTEDDEVRILGKKGYQFIKYTADEIQADCDFDFSVESMRMARANKAQIMINALNILAAHPVFQPYLANKDIEGMLDFIFENMTSMPKEVFDKDPNELMPRDPNEENEEFLNGEDVGDPNDDEDHFFHAQTHFKIDKEMNDDPNYLLHIKKHLDKYKTQQMQAIMIEQQMRQPSGGGGGSAENEPSLKGGALPNPSQPAPNRN